MRDDCESECYQEPYATWRRLGREVGTAKATMCKKTEATVGEKTEEEGAAELEGNFVRKKMALLKATLSPLAA